MSFIYKMRDRKEGKSQQVNRGSNLHKVLLLFAVQAFRSVSLANSSRKNVTNHGGGGSCVLVGSFPLNLLLK